MVKLLNHEIRGNEINFLGVNVKILAKKHREVLFPQDIDLIIKTKFGIFRYEETSTGNFLSQTVVVGNEVFTAYGELLCKKEELV